MVYLLLKNKMFSLLAKITAKEEFAENIKEELSKLIKPSRAKEGCLGYTMYTDNKKQNVFYFVEKWENKEVFSAHMSSALIQDYSLKAEGKILQLELTKMNEVEV